MITNHNLISLRAASIIAEIAKFRKENQCENKDNEPYQQFVEGIIEIAMTVLEQLT